MTTRRRWLAALAVVVTAGAALAPAHGDEPPLPEGTEVAAGIPPFMPAPAARGDAAALAAWIQRMLEAGRAVKGTRRAAELLYSAAAMQAADPTTLLAAGRTYYEAWASAPTDDPMAAFAALGTFQVAVAAGKFEGAKPYGAWLEAYERRFVPADGDPVTARRFALLQRELATGFQSDVATLLAALGNHAGAAGRLERLAAQNPPGLGPLASLWERAALERFRAGQTAEARDDVQRALAAGPDPAQRARLFFWELHLRHGLLTAEGEMRPTGIWPGKAYLDDLESVLRELHGNPHVGALLLSAASSALLAKADEDALTLYRRALDDPALAQRLWQNASLWGALLPAVTVATRLKRFDEAEELLQEIERRAGEPVPLAEGLRVRVKLAREESARAAEDRDKPRPSTGPGPAPGAPRAAPELVPPAPSDEAPRGALPEPRTDGGPAGAIWLAVLGAVGALVALALLLRRRRR